MSYRLIDANELAIKYPEVNDMPCIYADLPNGLDGELYTCVAIPQNATNGDVIKAMFPNAEIRFMVNLSDMHKVRVKFGDNTYSGIYDDHTFGQDWWNASYTVGSEDKK